MLCRDRVAIGAGRASARAGATHERRTDDSMMTRSSPEAGRVKVFAEAVVPPSPCMTDVTTVSAASACVSSPSGVVIRSDTGSAAAAEPSHPQVDEDPGDGARDPDSSGT